jgi:hypothetical protein
MLSPTLFIEAKDFHNAWARAVRFVLRGGEKQTIGDTHEPKHITDACGLISMTGNAIKQIEAHEIHPQYPFKHIKQYCAEFTHDFVKAHTGIDVPANEQFDYLYFDRLTWRMVWTGIVGDDPLIRDQLRYMRIALADQIALGISSNRSQAITWEPEHDIESMQEVFDGANRATPCLQRVWVRYLGKKEVEVHLTWESRDLYTAWQSNVIALVAMVNREIVIPNGCRIVKIVDFSDSLHVYDGDAEAAAQVKLVLENPQMR